MTRKGSTQDAPATTAQKLGSIVKSARDIMRKDKGLFAYLRGLQSSNSERVKQMPIPDQIVQG